MATKKIQCSDCENRGESIFCTLEEAVLSEVSAVKVMNTYKKGQVLFHEGNPPFGLFCVNSGKVKLTRTSPDGKDAITRIVGGGDILGQQSLLNNQTFHDTATAIEETQVCFIDKKYVQNLIQKKPDVALGIISKLTQEITESEEKIAHFFQKNVRERLGELLLDFQAKYGVKEADGKIRLEIKLTREEIASMIGVATETLIRLISEFKDEGIIHQEGKVIYISDSERLKEFAGL